jgi:hypothetical protein
LGVPRLLLLAVCLALVATPSAAATPYYVDQAASGLRSDPIYVHPETSVVSEAEANRLRERIAQSGAGPFYVAIVPSGARNEAGGDATDWLRMLAEALDRRGTYAVVVDNQFRAGSNVLERGEAARLATEAFDEHGDEGVASTLLAFVDKVAEQRSGGSSAGDSDDTSLWPILAVAGAGALGFVLLRRRRRARRDREALTTGKAVAQEDMLALADDIRALDLDVELPGVDREAKDRYGRAVDAYQRADRAYDTARRPQDLAAVSSALEEGRYEMASAKARLEGRDPPERRPPCFFDPRHGPSERNVLWAPPGGEPREVPACAADALRLEEGRDPEQREVDVGGQRTPYWGVPGLTPYASGFYGLWGGGLFPGFLLGSMFGGLGAEDASARTGDDFGGDFGDGLTGGDWGGGGDFGGGGGGDF